MGKHPVQGSTMNTHGDLGESLSSSASFDCDATRGGLFVGVAATEQLHQHHHPIES